VGLVEGGFFKLKIVNESEDCYGIISEDIEELFTIRVSESNVHANCTVRY
jgi:hypothetical protein